jgi:hypothetical protein
MPLTLKDQPETVGNPLQSLFECLQVAEAVELFHPVGVLAHYGFEHLKKFGGNTGSWFGNGPGISSQGMKSFRIQADENSIVPLLSFKKLKL